VTQTATPARASAPATVKTMARRVPRDLAPAESSIAADITSPTPPLYQQIEQAWLSNGTSVTVAGREDLLALRCRRIKRIFGDLARAGFPLERIMDLQDNHARSLVAYWRRTGKAVATIRSEWSILRSFAKAIGKAQLDCPLERYWQDAPKAPAAKKIGGALPARHQDPVVVKALQTGRDRTHYFIERSCQLLRLTVQDALILDPALLSSVSPEHHTAAVGLPKKLAAVISAYPAEVQVLAGELITFLREQGRPSLLWTDHSLGQAMRKHENHLAYQRRRSREGEESL
jgi:hypothetical protein